MSDKRNTRTGWFSLQEGETFGTRIGKLLRLDATKIQLAKFFLAGVVAFSVDLGLLTVQVAVLSVDPILARAISYSCGLTTAWLINRSITFREHPTRPLWREYVSYCTVNGLGGTLNFLTYVMLVKFVAVIAHYPEAGAVIGAAVGFGFNFLGSKFVVFRIRRKHVLA